MAFQITPRVPVHGKFRDSPFVEMRYVRFDNGCLEAALLFALFEEASMPASFHLRKVLCARNLSGQLLQYVELSRQCPSSTLLAAWNSCPEFLSAVWVWWQQDAAPHQSGDISMNLREEFNLTVVRYQRDKSIDRTRRSTIFLSEERTNEIVLLYPFYCRDSFVETACRHLHLRYSLFKQAREKMPVPMDRNAFVQLQCGIDNCTEQIGDFVFTLGSAPSTFQSMPFQDVLILMQHGTQGVGECCQRNPIHEYVFFCIHPMCRNCVTVMLCSNQHSCPNCIAPMRMKFLADLEAVYKIQGISLRQTLLCEKCKMDLELQYFKKIQSVDHECRVCDECMQSRDSYAVCGRPVQSREQSSEFPINPTEFGEYQADKCSLCQQRREISQFSLCCKLEHNCFYCDFCAYQGLSSPPVNCIQCGNVFSNTERKRIAREKGTRTSVVCLYCAIEKEISEFSVSMKLSHWWKCRICSSCFMQFGTPTECFICKQLYSQNERNAIDSCLLQLAEDASNPVSRAALLSTKSIHGASIANKELCDCGQSKARFRISCVNGCLCGVCLYTHYLLTNVSNCPHCESRIGTFPRVERCSGCFSEFGKKGKEILGVCATGCVLCGLCIRIVKESGSCAACRSEVIMKSISEIRSLQKKYSLGCYCDSAFHDPFILKCNHPVHKGCTQTIIRCRICWTSYNSATKKPTNIIALIS